MNKKSLDIASNKYPRYFMDIDGVYYKVDDNTEKVYHCPKNHVPNYHPLGVYRTLENMIEAVEAGQMREITECEVVLLV